MQELAACPALNELAFFSLPNMREPRMPCQEVKGRPRKPRSGGPSLHFLAGHSELEAILLAIAASLHGVGRPLLLECRAANYVYIARYAQS